jgi:O-antigen/teichoic acid export membrane protein
VSEARRAATRTAETGHGVATEANSSATDEISYGRGAALLSALIGITGLLTYAFHSLVAHSLGREQYGLIGVLWAAVFLTASVIYRPVEQLLSRTIAERQARQRSAGPALRVAAMIQLGLAATFLIAALVLRSTIEDELFSGSETLYWALVAAVLFYAASFFARGFLAGQRRFGLYGGVVMMEASSRVVFALLLAVGVASGRDFAAIAIAAGPLLSLIVVPWALGRQVRRFSARGSASGSGEPEFTITHGLGFAGAVLVVMFSEQTILNSGVLIVKADTQSDTLAALIFAVLMVARAPLQLFQAVSTTLLPHLTRLLVREQGEAHEGDFGRSVRLTALACLGFGALTLVGVLAVGPPVMKLLFGLRIRAARPGAGGGGYGALSRGHDFEPGGAGPGTCSSRRLFLGNGGHLLRRLPARGLDRRDPRGGARVRRHRSSARERPLPRLPPPDRTRGRAAPPGLGRGARGEVSRGGRGNLSRGRRADLSRG